MKSTYYLTKSFKFDAAHFLKGYNGKCALLHGHTWKLDITIATNELDSFEMVMDFADLKLLVEEIILKRLDHNFLNAVLKTNYPTAETVAQWVFEKLDNIFDGDISLYEVKVWESDNSCVGVKKCL